MNKRLFAFDMDGTILNSKNKVQQATIDAMKVGKEKGHSFIIATGRPFKDALRDIGGAAEYIDYLVCNNGTYYSSADETDVKYFGEVPAEVLENVITIGKENNCFFALHGSKEAQRSYLGGSLDDID